MRRDYKEVGPVVTLALKAVAMAVASMLTALRVASIETDVVLLSIGLFALSITSLQESEKQPEGPLRQLELKGHPGSHESSATG